MAGGFGSVDDLCLDMKLYPVRTRYLHGLHHTILVSVSRSSSRHRLTNGLEASFSDVEHHRLLLSKSTSDGKLRQTSSIISPVPSFRERHCFQAKISIHEAL